MNFKRTALSLALAAGFAAPAQAADLTWICPDSTLATWDHADCWAPFVYGVPDGLDNAWIGSGLTTSIKTDLTGEAYTLYLNGGGRLNVHGALTTTYARVGYQGAGTLVLYSGDVHSSQRLYVGDGAGGSGSYRMLDGAHSITDLAVIGHDGAGSFELGSRYMDMTKPGPRHEASTLTLADTAGSSGSYTIVGSKSKLSSGSVYVGDRGIGTFSQADGQHLISGNLTIGASSGGSGTYTLEGGTLSTPTAIIGDYGRGTFVQTGGAHTVGSYLMLGTATGGYGGNSLQGGTLNVGQNLTVGARSEATFGQAGGTLTTNRLSLGSLAGSYGVYNLTGGTLNVGTVANGVGWGELNINGGTLHLSSNSSTIDVDQFSIGGAAGANASFALSAYQEVATSSATVGASAGSVGALDLSGGYVVAGSLTVGFGGQGSVTNSGGTTIVSNNLTLGFYSGSSGQYTLSDSGELRTAT